VKKYSIILFWVSIIFALLGIGLMIAVINTEWFPAENRGALCVVGFAIYSVCAVIAICTAVYIEQKRMDRS